VRSGVVMDDRILIIWFSDKNWTKPSSVICYDLTSESCEPYREAGDNDNPTITTAQTSNNNSSESNSLSPSCSLEDSSASSPGTQSPSTSAPEVISQPHRVLANLAMEVQEAQIMHNDCAYYTHPNLHHRKGSEFHQASVLLLLQDAEGFHVIAQIRMHTSEIVSLVRFQRPPLPVIAIEPVIAPQVAQVRMLLGDGSLATFDLIADTRQASLCFTDSAETIAPLPLRANIHTFAQGRAIAVFTREQYNGGSVMILKLSDDHTRMTLHNKFACARHGFTREHSLVLLHKESKDVTVYSLV